MRHSTRERLPASWRMPQLSASPSHNTVAGDTNRKRDTKAYCHRQSERFLPFRFTPTYCTREERNAGAQMLSLSTFFPTGWDLNATLPAGCCEFVKAKGVKQFSTQGPLRRPRRCYYAIMALSYCGWDCFQASVLFVVSSEHTALYYCCFIYHCRHVIQFKLCTSNCS